MITRKYVSVQLDTTRRERFERGDLEGTLTGYQDILQRCETEGAEEDALAVCCRDTADILYEIGRKGEAYQMYDRALMYDVTDKNIRAHTLLNKGLSFVQEGRKDDGLKLLEEAGRIAIQNELKTVINNNYKLLSRSIAQKTEPEVLLATERQFNDLP